MQSVQVGTEWRIFKMKKSREDENAKKKNVYSQKE